MGTKLRSKKGAEPPPIFGPFLLWTNGWMQQDATWHGGRTQPKRLCLTWEPSPPFPKRDGVPNFRSMSIVAKRLHGSRCHIRIGRPWLTRHCFRWAPSSPPLKGHAPQFSANVRCGQMARWTKMPPRMELARPRPRRLCVRTTPRKGHTHPTQFLVLVYCGQTAGWMKLILGTEVGLSPGDFVLDRDPVSLPKRGQSPQIFGPCFFVAKWPDG